MRQTTMKHLRARPSERSATIGVLAWVHARVHMNLGMLTHVRNITVAIRTVGALVPFVRPRVPVTGLDIAVRAVLVAMVNIILHALVAVRANHIGRG